MKSSECVLVCLEREGQASAAAFITAPSIDTAKEWIEADRYGLAERGFQVKGMYRVVPIGTTRKVPSGGWETLSHIYLE